MPPIMATRHMFSRINFSSKLDVSLLPGVPAGTCAWEHSQQRVALYPSELQNLLWS